MKKLLCLSIVLAVTQNVSATDKWCKQEVNTAITHIKEINIAAKECYNVLIIDKKEGWQEIECTDYKMINHLHNLTLCSEDNISNLYRTRPVLMNKYERYVDLYDAHNLLLGAVK